MKAAITGAIFLAVALIIAIVLIIAVFSFGQTSSGLQKSALGFFELLDKLFGFFEQKVFLSSQQTKDFFCEKPLNDVVKLCELKSDVLKDYCDSTPDEKVIKCENAEGALKRFCSEKESDRDRFCQDPRQFFEFCDQVKQIKDLDTIATDLTPLKKVTQFVLCR